jgi:hypothetical protein
MKPSRLLFTSIALAGGALTSTAFAEDSSIYTWSGKCVDVPGGNTADGTAVQIWDCLGNSNQQWQWWSDGTVRFSADTNKCLDLPGWETADGTPIQIYDCNGGSNQQWSFVNGTLQGFGGKCVDDPGASATNGTLLQYWDCIGDGNQGFNLAPAVYGDILTRWQALGGPNGALGLPTTDELADGADRIRYFANGFIWWSSNDADTVTSIGGNQLILNVPDPNNIFTNVSLSLSSNGNYAFGGAFTGSASPDSLGIGWRAADGAIFEFAHQGVETVSADTWSNVGNNPAIAADWNNIEYGWYAWERYASADVPLFDNLVADLGGVTNTISPLGVTGTSLVTRVVDGSAHRYFNLRSEDENRPFCMGIEHTLFGNEPLEAQDCSSNTAEQVWRTVVQPGGDVNPPFLSLQNADVIPDPETSSPFCASENINPSLFSSTNVPNNAGALFDPACYIDPSDPHQAFQIRYVQDDSGGFPCFTIQNEASKTYMGLDYAPNALSTIDPFAPNQVPQTPLGDNPFISVGPNDHSQLWCDHSVRTEQFNLNPRFIVTAIYYALPTKASSVTYSQTTSFESTLTSTASSEQDMEQKTIASGMAGPKETNATAQLTADTQVKQTATNVNSVDIVTSSAFAPTYKGQADTVDHDYDEISFVINPTVQMSFIPGTAGMPDIAQAALGGGDTSVLIDCNGDGVPDTQQYDHPFNVYVGELLGHIPWIDSNDPVTLACLGFTSNDLAQLLQADPLAPPLEGSNSLDPSTLPGRFVPLNQVCTTGGCTAANEVSFGQPGSGSSTQLVEETVSKMTQTTTDTLVTEVGYTIQVGSTAWGLSFSDAITQTWIWTQTMSQANVNGTDTKDTIVIGDPATDNGGRLVHIYKDLIFQNYAFSVTN